MSSEQINSHNPHVVLKNKVTLGHLRFPSTAWFADALPHSIGLTILFAIFCMTDAGTTQIGVLSYRGIEGNPLATTYSVFSAITREILVLSLFFTFNMLIWPLRHRLSAMSWVDKSISFPNFAVFCYDGIWRVRPKYKDLFKKEKSFRELVILSWYDNLPFNIVVLLTTPLILTLARLLATMNNFAVILWPNGETLASIHSWIYLTFSGITGETFESDWTFGYILFSFTIITFVFFPISWLLTMNYLRRINIDSASPHPDIYSGS